MLSNYCSSFSRFKSSSTKNTKHSPLLSLSDLTYLFDIGHVMRLKVGVVIGQKGQYG